MFSPNQHQAINPSNNFIIEILYMETIIPHTLQEVTINYKPSHNSSSLHKIATSKEAIDVLRLIWSDRMNYVEEMYLLLLNRGGCLIGYCKLSQGGTSSTIVDVKMILQVAIKANAHSLILAHNHPSGNIKPSEADLLLTRRVKESCKLMDIALLDHVILTTESFYSFADEGGM